jgi:hypothetical protein
MTGFSMENTPIQFVEGMNFHPVPPNAPETVRGKIYIDWKKFRAYAEANVDGKGWINVKMMKSMKTQGIYFIKDNYVPKTETPESKEYNDTKYKHPDEGVQSANEHMIEKLFNAPLSEDEEFRLSNQPF